MTSTPTFAALHVRNFRLFAAAQLLSNIGAWAQRVAQDWLVLSLTHNPAAVGVTMAFQFAPTLLFGLYGGVIADRFPRRRLLLATQSTACVLATTLAALALSGLLTVAVVDLIAFALGLVVAVDNPTRQSFVGELVGPGLLRNAVSLNATAFQLGGLVGPALAGLAIGAVGPSWVFAVNACTYLPVLAALLALDPRALVAPPAVETEPAHLVDGLRYVWDRPRLLWLIVLVGVVGGIGLNLPVVLTAFSTDVFHVGPTGYGLMTALVAGGSMIGALLSARRVSMRLRWVVASGAGLGLAEALAAIAPGPEAFGVLLVLLGAAALTFITGANTSVQLATPPAVRGRVMAVYLLVLVGSAPIGAPLVGLVAADLGPRAAMLLAGLAPLVAAIVVAVQLAPSGRLAAYSRERRQQRFPSAGTVRLSR